MDFLVRIGVRHPRPLLVLVLLLSGFSCFGLLKLRVETGVLSWLPSSHPNVRAFARIFESLSGAVYQELLWLELDAAKSGAAGVTSIVDHASLAAQEALVAHVRSRVPQVRGVFGVLPWIQLLNGLGSGGGASAALPDDAAGTARLWLLLQSVAPDLVRALVSPDRRGTIVSFILDAPSDHDQVRELGLALGSAIASFPTADASGHDIFASEYLVPAGLASGTAVLDETIRQDLLRLTPLAAGFLVAVLAVVLGNWRAVLAVCGLLLVGLLWTLGLMGWCGTPLNIITVALLPLILGCGINYALLIALEVLDRRVDGADPGEALERVGRSSAVGIYLTTLTTLAGLLTLCFSDSPGMVQLGFHAAGGMAALALLSVLVLPSWVARIPFHKRSRFGPIIGPIARSLTRNRRVVLIVYSIATACAWILVQKPNFQLDVIEGNYPLDAPITKSVRRMQASCGGTFPEIIIASGRLSQPAVVESVNRTIDRLQSETSIGERFRIVGFTDILGLHSLLAKGSMQEAAFALLRHGGKPRRAAPSSEEGLRAGVKALYADPAWEALARMFIDPSLEVGTILLLGGDAGRDRDSVRAIWEQLSSAIGGDSSGGAPLSLSFLGYRTMSYLFIEHSLKWIRTIAIVSFITVLVAALVVLRSLRALMTLAVLLSTSGLIWFGVLQLFEIYISIFLLFPMVFSICVGSDYALHILCRLQADRAWQLQAAATGSGESHDGVEWTYNAWASTGRAIAIAALTDGGVFAIYSLMRMVSIAQLMLAIVLAVAAIFAATVFLVPAMMFPRTTLGPARSWKSSPGGAGSGGGEPS